MIYYIADLHYGHKSVIRFDKRPFADVELMEEVLIHNWNERVTEDDTVYVLGDAFWKNEEGSVNIIKRLNGHKHLIQGNHDRVHGRLRFHWESIKDYDEVNDNGRFVVMCHYPIPFYNKQHHDSIMLYGHVHNTREWEMLEKWKLEQWEQGIPCKMINIGCMMSYMNYTPRTLDEILAENPSPKMEDEKRMVVEELPGYETENKMQWFAVMESESNHSFMKFNVFDHPKFYKEVTALLKKKPSREELSDKLQTLVMYYYWCKCEWEMVICSWPPSKYNAINEKVDVYQQLRLNWEPFVDYVFQFVPKSRPRKKKE